MNRIEGNDINDRLNDPEDMMMEVMQLLNDTVTIPTWVDFIRLYTMQKLLISDMTSTL